ncbi:uncharacterized protein LOC123874246 [Maniola jurtina]|uniref:uncharacterized protein LOC123874246 n=1 Tax=Maniola jurtina TaxID=191418 RepID=UPI001E688D76|nr:uncharacterized protein LOC123874246 [Maniola jurtina]
MDHKELGRNSSVNTGVNDGSTKFALNTNSPTVQSSRNKSYDVGPNSLGKVETTTGARPCAIIGPDRVVPPNPDDTMYLKKMPGEAWPPPENVYRRPPDYPTKISDYQPTRNISPRQTFQENMQRIMVPPTFSSVKSSEVSNLKNPKLNMPQEAKYCDVPYNVNSVNSEHKSVRNSDLPMSNVSPYPRNMPPPYGWPTGVNVRPLRPYGAPEFYQYQEYPSCAGPRPMTMIRPHRPLYEESAQVYSERLYQDANIRFKPYPTGKEKHQQPRYDYVSNYPSTFHPPASLPPHKYDVQKSIHGHPYPVCPPVPYKYLDRRIHEPFVDGYHRTHSQANFNAFHSQVVPPPYGPIPGNCMQNKTYSDASSKPLNVNKIQFENNSKVYLNLESRNKNYSVPENLYYNEMNHSQAMRGEILLPTHPMLNIPPMPQHSIYRKDNTPLKPYDHNPNYRIFDQSINVNHSMQRLPMQFSPNTVAISPSDSNTSNDTTHTIGTSQEDCGYVSQSSAASIRSFDSSNIPMSHDIYRRYNYNNYDMLRNTFHSVGAVQIPKNKTSSPNKKNLDVRQFLQMWNEGDEEVSEASKEAATQNHSKKNSSRSEIINNQEQLYVLGLVNVPNEELGKYDHIQKISKLPENIKGYNSIEILKQYEELLETPHVSNYNRSREFSTLSKAQIDKDITTKMPRPISPLDVEAKISQSVIHKEVGCNFEIKPCSPQMLNVEVAAPVRNVLGERIIEKVVNPIITKSPKLNRGEKNQLQNTVDDAVTTTSCKMVSDQYSSNSSPKETKASNYSVQDLERNAGLCLASLPQLDNDIELNFPEINQQFIKANQIESNVVSGLQNLPHIDLEQTQYCLPQETRNDSQQLNLSPQFPLGSGVDKEFSKLSKYRKGRKCEIPSSHNMTKQELQRIDSVIIKNPDTNKSQDSEAVKITSETNHSFHKETVLSYSSLEYHRNIKAHDLSSETAIDFSLNRSEEEPDVSYLNEMDRNVNQNLPPLEKFDEEGLNEGEDICLTSGSIQVRNTSAELHITPSAELVEELQSECPKFRTNKDYKNGKQNNNQYEDLIKVPVESPTVSANANANEKGNVLVMSNEEAAKPKLHTKENLKSTENVNNFDTLGVNSPNNHSNLQKFNEENLFTNLKDTTKYKKDVKEFETECTDESEKDIDLSSPVKPVVDNEDQYSCDKSANGLKNEVVSNKVSEISFVTKTFIGNDTTENQTIEEVLNDLSNQNIDNLVIKCSPTHNTIKNDNGKDFTGLNHSLSKNEEIFEFVSNISVVSESNRETQTGTTRTEGIRIETNQAVTSETNVNDCKLEVLYDEQSTTVAFEQESENKIKNISDIMSSYSEEISCAKNETDPPDLLAIEITECNSQPVLKSPSPEIQQGSKMKMFVSGFELKKNAINDCDKTVFNISKEAFSKETKSELSQSAKLLDPSDNDYLSNESDPNSNVQKDTYILKDVTESTSSDLEFEECRKSKESFQTAMEQKEEYETNMDTAESECLFDKDDTVHNSVEDLCVFVNKTLSENPNAKITECKQETKIDGHLETDHKINEDVVQFECLPDNSYILTNTVEEPCLFTKNMTHPENLSVITREDRHETDIKDSQQTNYETPMNTAESELLSRKLYINSIQPVEESSLKSCNNSAIISSEFRSNIETDNKQKDFKSFVDKVEAKYLSDNVEEHRPDIESDNCKEKDFKPFVDKAEAECSSNNVREHRPDMKTDNSKQKDFKLLFVDKAETDCLSNNVEEHRPDIETENSKQEDFKPFVDKAEDECSTNNVREHRLGIKMDNSKQKDFKLFVDKAEADCLSYNVEECRPDIETENSKQEDFKLFVDKAEAKCLSNIVEKHGPDIEKDNSKQKDYKVLVDKAECLSNNVEEHRPDVEEHRPDIETDNSKEKDFKSFVDKAEAECSSNNVRELRSDIKTDNSKQNDFKQFVDKSEADCLSNNVEEHCLHFSHETFGENSVSEGAENEEKIEVKDNGVSVAKLNIIDNSFEFQNETKTFNIENNSLQSFKNQSQVSVINMGFTNCQKELFSPRFQKLLMFSEGICKSSKNKYSLAQEYNCGENTVELEDARFVNVELVFSENNDVNNEFHDIEREAKLSNGMHIEVLQSEHIKKQGTVQNNGSLTEKDHSSKNEDAQFSPAVVDDSAVIKPRKISKRSLSESALETYYKNNDDVNFVQPCKRKKGLKKSQNFLESHMITEDICNIIQSNRRNSISTFYNEDNVYILIDNDFILTEENDDADKLCYTENSEEFLRSKETANCEINLDLDSNLYPDEPNQLCEHSESVQLFEEKSLQDSWVDDVACIETVFSDDVAENIIIDVHESPEKLNSLDLESDDGESTVFYDSDHIDKLKSIYGRTICNDNTQLIETLYRTPQMNVNKTLYHIESQDPEECHDAINDRCLKSNEHNNDCTDILESGISSDIVIDNKEKMFENLSLDSKDSKYCHQNIYPNFNHDNDFKFDFSCEEQEDKFTGHSCELSDYITSNIQKENSSYSCSSSPEVSSTTSEEKSSSILLKITNCNGSRVSQINEVNPASHSKLSYKLTEKREYRSYCSNFSSSRTLITKAAQKYIPPLKETIYDLKVKLPLPQHRLQSLKQLKIAKMGHKVKATASIGTVKRPNHDISKKQKPKFEDVLKSIDELNFKRHKDNVKKGKISVPKVIIKKNENGAHYASSKTFNRKETYNPDLTGRKWQPWVFLEKNNFVDKMALQNKDKAVYCHKKNTYVLLDKIRKYKSIYNANFVISQPKSETKGNLKYTIRLKHN